MCTEGVELPSSIHSLHTATQDERSNAKSLCILQACPWQMAQCGANKKRTHALNCNTCWATPTHREPSACPMRKHSEEQFQPGCPTWGITRQWQKKGTGKRTFKAHFTSATNVCMSDRHFYQTAAVTLHVHVSIVTSCTDLQDYCEW
jgi:hypothetical protein